MVLFAIAAGYGLSMLLGVPFTSLQQILPFILIGIGVDDAFVIVAAFDRTDKSKPIEDRMHTAMHRVGMSVTMTSLTDVAAFMLARLRRNVRTPAQPSSLSHSSRRREVAKSRSRGVAKSLCRLLWTRRMRKRFRGLRTAPPQ